MQDQQALKNTDSAALAVAVAAGVLGLYSDQRPYDWLSLIFGVTLLTTTIAYVRGHYRTRMQSLAVAFTVGFISISVFGYVFEHILRLTFLRMNCSQALSCVPSWSHVIWWLGVANVAYSFDRKKNRLRSES